MFIFGPLPSGRQLGLQDESGRWQKEAIPGGHPRPEGMWVMKWTRSRWPSDVQTCVWQSEHLQRWPQSRFHAAFFFTRPFGPNKRTLGFGRYCPAFIERLYLIKSTGFELPPRDSSAMSGRTRLARANCLTQGTSGLTETNHWQSLKRKMDESV